MYIGVRRERELEKLQDDIEALQERSVFVRQKWVFETTQSLDLTQWLEEREILPFQEAGEKENIPLARTERLILLYLLQREDSVKFKLKDLPRKVAYYIHCYLKHHGEEETEENFLRAKDKLPFQIIVFLPEVLQEVAKKGPSVRYTNAILWRGGILSFQKYKGYNFSFSNSTLLFEKKLFVNDTVF